MRNHLVDKMSWELR